MSTLVTTNIQHGGAASPNVVLASGGGVTFGGNVTLGTSVLATPSGSAPSYTCRAWVNFNGTGAVAIRASGNVTSITDNGTGDYTVIFTTAMPDANFSLSATCNGESGLVVCGSVDATTYSTTSARFRVRAPDTSTSFSRDSVNVSAAIFR